jgi:rhodanese-related sulfurtransferase
MIKLSKQNYVVGLALFIAFILAFFPTSSFVRNPFIVNTQLKQQKFNESGIFTVSPFEAAKYYSYDQSKCFWIDLRDSKDFSKSHIKIALNQTFEQLHNSSWSPDDLILVYGNNTYNAQEAVAYLRQVKNAQAFAIKGGFAAVKKYLIDPIGISVTNELSDNDLQTLLRLRNKISGENVSPEQLLDKLKSGKSKKIREGC